MKKTKYVSAFFFQFLFAGILAFSIQQSALAQAKEEIIPSTKHAGYSVKPGMGPEKGFQGYMLYRRTNLKDLLEEGKRMPGDTLNFKQCIGITMMGAKSDLKTEIQLTKVTTAKNNLKFYFTSKTGKKQSKFTVPLYVGTIPKQLGIKGIQFYMDGKLLEDVHN